MFNKGKYKMGTGENQKPRKKENGFSLIEMLIALSVLALSTLAAASLQYTAVRNNTTGNTATQAVMLAKAQLEMLKNQTIDLGGLPAGTYSDPTSIDEYGNPGGIYNRSWSIANLGTWSRRLSVTVQWSKFGANRQVTVRSSTQGGGV